jgi:F-type H+-transporting ATPase subunit epsilon
MAIQVNIVSAEGEIYAGKAKMVFAPARMGEIGIAPRHAPLLTDLKPGSVRVEGEDGEDRFFYVTGGILEVQPYLVTILADSALHADQLDEDAALAAREQKRRSKAGMAKSISNRRKPNWSKPRRVTARPSNSKGIASPLASRLRGALTRVTRESRPAAKSAKGG